MSELALQFPWLHNWHNTQVHGLGGDSGAPSPISICCMLEVEAFSHFQNWRWWIVVYIYLDGVDQPVLKLYITAPLQGDGWQNLLIEGLRHSEERLGWELDWPEPRLVGYGTPSSDDSTTDPQDDA